MKKPLLIFAILVVAATQLAAQPGLYRTRKSKVDFVSDAPLEFIKASSFKW
jgi:hypothetical protein